MPGILPMKVIKVGTSSQARIAQACDRCRSKKIRCDGVRPSCTQCINVGFECKTSDKLSRRAFPRGYTESLEERVRSLEAEVRELKDLLDEKDEKIDMLSRIHSHSPQSTHISPRPSISHTLSGVSSRSSPVEKDDTFKVNQSSILIETEGSDSYFLGTSSGRTLIDAFKNKVRELGKGSIDERADSLLRGEAKRNTITTHQPVQWRAPPRMLSDQLINIFFQEWAPLYPVLHRPTFLQLYEEYVASPESMTDKYSLAQLHLVFGIASQSSLSRDEIEVASIERQWRAAVDAIASRDSMATLQCLTLAQIYCLLTADASSLLRYKGLAIALSQRLGVHQSQKRFALGTLTRETRKKVFWTLYTLDCFSAAQLGLPRQLRDEDIHCEYPVDADDEYVTEKGFLPTLPGESTKISSALALFRAARVLANVLQDLYPASSPHEISFKTVTSLSNELDAWLDSLPPHLRLQFAQDKPSTNVVTSRSPLLSLAYQYIQSAIHRPVVCASSTLGDRASSSIVAVATAAKRTIQIIQLLDERSLSFSFCLNRNELLIASGFGLLFQCLDLDQDGKLIKNNQRMLGATIELVERGKAVGSRNFRKIVSVILAPQIQQKYSPPILSRTSSDSASSTTAEAIRNTQKQLKALAARFSFDRHRQDVPDSNEIRRATVPLTTTHSNGSQGSLSSIRSEPAMLAPKSRPSQSPASNAAPSPILNRSTQQPKRTTNLDYLSFNGAPSSSSKETVRPRQSMPHLAPAPPKSGPEIADTDWERLIGSLDQSDSNIYDSIYGGQTASALDGIDLTSLPLSTSAIEAQNLVWSNSGTSGGSITSGMKPPSDSWMRHHSLASMGSYSNLDGYPLLASPAPVPQSVLSFSDESLTSGEDFGSVHSGMRSTSLSAGMKSGGSGSDEVEFFKGLIIPADSVSPSMYTSGTPEDLGVLDAGFGL